MQIETVSVYLIHLNSRESPRLSWLLTAASSSGGSSVAEEGIVTVMHGGRLNCTVKPSTPWADYKQRGCNIVGDQLTQVQTHAWYRNFGVY